MSEFAKNINGETICASDFSDDEWNDVKSNYQIGEFKMICCNADAIPKTSIKYSKFFAHHFDECSTAPETIWHKLTKSLIIQELRMLGINATEEMNNIKWKADVFFNFKNRKIVIEAQHSHQTLNEYLERQNIYKKDNIEAYWLLYKSRFQTLTKAITQYKIKYEFNGSIPKETIFPCIENLPTVYFEIDDDCLIKGVNLLQCTLKEWVNSILENRFVYHEHKWQINNKS
ncbi:competence protein CoiA [Leptospira mtsangambouensis]|uniref:competence protein CoiA n=1 Tax=Leptospira mtsangambouensis TaxID=2484912 RepID=UPI001EEC6B15|nr:competence protein CoiA family protein [Leptospira mtsangambouensis]MCG6142815.1 competence protein CoiA [Leptospira mtsangambouensis]